MQCRTGPERLRRRGHQRVPGQGHREGVAAGQQAALHLLQGQVRNHRLRGEQVQVSCTVVQTVTLYSFLFVA